MLLVASSPSPPMVMPTTVLKYALLMPLFMPISCNWVSVLWTCTSWPVLDETRSPSTTETVLAPCGWGGVCVWLRSGAGCSMALEGPIQMRLCGDG